MCQKKQARERVRAMWKMWKGPSQRWHYRWKTRDTSIAREKQRDAKGGTATAPTRGVPKHDSHIENNHTDNVDKAIEEPQPAPICVISAEAPETSTDYMTEVPTEELASDDAKIFTRMTDPFKPAHVAEIQRLVTIRDDLMNQERLQVQSLISEFADRARSSM